MPSALILSGVALVIWGYVDCYQQTLEELRQPGVMYCGFLPLGVLSDLFWMQEYRWHLIGCVVLAVGGIVLSWLLKRSETKTETV